MDEQDETGPSASDVTYQVKYGDNVKTLESLENSLIVTAFSLPPGSNIQFQDENGLMILPESVKPNQEINIVVKRAKKNRQQRNAQTRLFDARVDLEQGMLMLQSKLSKSHNSVSTIVVDDEDEGDKRASWSADIFRGRNVESLATEFDATWKELTQGGGGLRRSISLTHLLGDEEIKESNIAAVSEPDMRKRASTLAGQHTNRECKVKQPLPLKSTPKIELDVTEDIDGSLENTDSSLNLNEDRVEANFEAAVDLKIPPPSESSLSYPFALQRSYVVYEDEDEDQLQLILSDSAPLEDRICSYIFIAEVDNDAPNHHVRRGDIILEIEGESCRDMSLEIVIGILQGAIQKQTVLHLKLRPLNTHKIEAMLERLQTLSSDEVPKILHRSSAYKLASFFGAKHEDMDPEQSFLYTITKSGVLARKSVLKSAGHKTKRRTWKQYYVALRGHVMYFYNDAQESEQPVTIDPSGGRVSIKSCLCDIAYDYTKRKHVFRLRTFAGAEYLLQANSEIEMLEWIKTIQQHNNPDNNEKATYEVIKRTASHALFSRGSSSSSLSSKSGSRTNLSPGRSKLSKSNKTKRNSASSLSFVPAAVQADEIGGCLKEPIISACDRFNSPAPPILIRLLEEIENRGLDEEGLYRQSGSNSVIVALKQALSVPDISHVDLSVSSFPDQHALCGVVKEYIRSLPDPILTADNYDKFIAAVKAPPEETKSIMKHLLLELPPQHLSTLEVLVNHLLRVVEHSHINKMASSNIALIFGPTLVRSKHDNTMTMLSDMRYQNMIVEQILRNHEEFFPSAKDTSNVSHEEENEEALDSAQSSAHQSQRASTSSQSSFLQHEDESQLSRTSSSRSPPIVESHEELAEEAFTDDTTNILSAVHLRNLERKVDSEQRATWVIEEFDRLAVDQIHSDSESEQRPISMASTGTIKPESSTPERPSSAENRAKPKRKHSLPMRKSCEIALDNGPPEKKPNFPAQSFDIVDDDEIEETHVKNPLEDEEENGVDDDGVGGSDGYITVNALTAEDEDDNSFGFSPRLPRPPPYEEIKTAHRRDVDASDLEQEQLMTESCSEQMDISPPHNTPKQLYLEEDDDDEEDEEEQKVEVQRRVKKINHSADRISII